MQFKMSRNSLFAILMRSPWWVSFVVAVVLSLLARLLLPEQLTPYALVSGLPFALVGCIAAWKQLRVPGPEKVAATLQALNALAWRDFATLLEQALRRDGYEVTRLPGPAADFALIKAGQGGVLSAKRWKAANQGIEPLRELDKMRQARAVLEAVYVTSGELTENARRYAADNNIRLLQGTELAQLMRGLDLGGKTA